MTEEERPIYARSLQELARHQMKTKLLADILQDMTICQLEGWDPLEFPLQIKVEMDNIIKQWNAKNVNSAKTATCAKPDTTKKTDKSAEALQALLTF